MMRILHWYPNLLGGGGVAGAVVGLARAQAALGSEVRIAAADEGGVPLYGGSVDEGLVYRWTPTFRRNIGSLAIRGVSRRARADLRAFAAEIVHVHGEFNPDNAWALHVARGAPAILAPHGAFDPGVFTKAHARSKRAYVATARPLLYRRMRAFHALSPREATHIRELVPHASVYVLPQGGGSAATERPSGSAVPDDPPRFLFVGRLDVYTKALDQLVRAFSAVLRTHTNARLTLVGPDWLGGRARLEELIAKEGLGASVTFDGELGAAEVAARIDTAHGVVLCSRHEGLSLSATEALIRGRPLVLSSQTGHASYPIVSTARHVRIVEPNATSIAAGLDFVAQNRVELGAAARRAAGEFAEFFSWERIAGEHLRTYAELGASGP